MTENEAKSCIQGKLDCMNKCDVFDCKNTDECDNCKFCYSQGNFGEQKKAFEMAIQALEEIQAYRAIGTVEEVKNAYGRGYNQGSIDRAEELQKCREYGYNKAIDEFVERARILCINRPIGCDCRENIPLYAHTDGTWHDLIADIAEAMKGVKE